MRRSLAILICLVSAAWGAEYPPCAATAKFSVSVDKNEHPTPDQPTSGMGLVYVVRDKASLGLVTTGLAVDGRIVGANNRGTYFFIELAPGEHHLCVGSQKYNLTLPPGFMKLVVESGRTYYVEQRRDMDGRLRLYLLDADMGKALVGMARWAKETRVKTGQQSLSETP